MKIYKTTIVILSPYDPRKTHELSDLVIDAECGESMIIGNKTELAEPEYVEEMSGDFFDLS